VQIGNERFAIHREIEELPPAVPLIVMRAMGHRTCYPAHRVRNGWTRGIKFLLTAALLGFLKSVEQAPSIGTRQRLQPVRRPFSTV